MALGGSSRLETKQLEAASDVSPSISELTPDTGSESDTYVDAALSQGSKSQTFELKELRPGLDEATPKETDGLVEEHESEDEDRTVQFGRSRTTSVRSAVSMEYTPEEEKAVLKKLDRRLALFMALLYLLSFLDRSNIGNAKIAGLSKDLNLSSDQYEWLLTSFYITYILFEWMTLLYKVIPPHIYIALCVASWGAIAAVQSVANSFAVMVVLRVLLGVSEAAFGPGVPYYLSFFYKRNEMATRVGFFISAAPLAISFASSLAYVIVKVAERSDIAGWRLLFLVEGFPSMIVAVFAWYFLPDHPGNARYFTNREKKVALLRVRKERMAGLKGGDEQKGLQWRQILKTLMDPKCYITAAMFFSCNVAFSSLPVFLPTIINDMGYSALNSQALSAPPYLFAFLLVLLTAYLSDYYRTRSIPLILHSLLSFLGYITLYLAGLYRLPHIVRYLALYLACAGFFSAITIIITWTINNQESSEGKGTGVVMLNVIGQMGPLLGTRLYPDEDGPYFLMGMGVCAGFMVGVCVLAVVLRGVLGRENERRRRESGSNEYRVVKAEDDGDGDGDEEEGTGMVSGQGREKEEIFMYIL
ncbi:MAG: hypothetical protein MMC33_007906 [Icmadophila ericetorum]|nr:hypothetical protein [Icmadophila ericetorum]